MMEMEAPMTKTLVRLQRWIRSWRLLDTPPSRAEPFESTWDGRSGQD
jgi:hypothetical protein